MTVSPERARPLSSLGSDVAAVMLEIVEQLLELPGADGASLSEVTAEGFHFLVSRGTDRALQDTDHGLTDGLGALSLQIDEPVVLRADESGEISGSLTAEAGAILLAPIAYGGATRGVLSVRSADHNAFTEAEVAAFHLISKTAAVALRNAALVENLRAIVETQSELSAMETDHEAVMTAIVNRVQRLTRADGAVIVRFEDGDAVWDIASGEAEKFVGLRYRSEGSVGDFTGQLDRTIYVDDTRNDARSNPDLQKRIGTRSLITAPLHHDGSVVGVLGVLGAKPHAFDALAVETTGLMAEFVSAVMQNAEELEGRQRLLRAFEESEARFRSAFQTSLVGVALMDLDARLVETNDKLDGLLGYEPTEMIGMLGAAVLQPDEVPAVEALMSELLAGHRGEWSRDVRARRKNGDELWVRLGMSIARDFDGAPLRFVTLVDDISDERALEDQLRHAQKMEAVGRLAGGIAHDFNNLLTAISGYTQFLVDGLEDEKLLGHAEEIKNAAARAASLTGQLLTFSRRQVTQPRVLDLNAVITNLEPMVQRLVGEDVELLTHLSPELGSIRVDPTQIEQALINIAVNARDAMPHGGSFTIATASHELAGEPGVSVVLTDTGVGMSADERTRLFEPYFSMKDGGAGLGLATVYGIVEQSGGAIDVVSEPGLGTSIQITFPRVEEAVEGSGQSAATVESTPAPGTGTVLLVEDESVVRQLVAEILEASGYSVLQAADGASAIEVLRRHVGTLDLLLTDVVMPGMSGRDVARAVTAMRPGTPVLFMSGYTDSAIDEKGVLEPGVHFVQKPFTATELTARIRTVLEARTSA
ncbi:MAG TPA: GAF domain-containing protein [Gaiellaceae bacterium]|jgi:PAS domain S-box-containing protein